MTEFCSWWAFSAEMIGAKVAREKMNTREAS